MPTPPIRRRGLLFVLSSPSGAGKTTLSRRLLATDTEISLSVSATTRAPRPGEVDGKDYHFLTPDRFRHMVAEGAFLEHATVFNNLYGTPRAPVEATLAAGKDVLFDIDWQGTQQLAETARADLVSVFILPPSNEELERRLHTRAQDSEEVIRGRMAKAASEMSHWPEYDYALINKDIDATLARIQAILTAERHRRSRLLGMGEFVRGLSGGPE